MDANGSLLQLLKEKSNILNAKCQQFQSDVTSSMNQMAHSNSNNANASIHNKIRSLCTGYSLTINALEAEYLLKCEKYLQQESMQQLSANKSSKCNICNKDCVTKSRLKDHLIQIHSHMKPFQCNECNKAFKIKRFLHAHVRDAHNGFPYQCRCCNEKFQYNSELRKHVKTTKCKTSSTSKTHKSTAKHNVYMDTNPENDSSQNPNYLEFSRSEKETLIMIRSLLQKLFHSVPELYSMENLSNRLCLNSELFVNWLYNKGQQPLIINDLHQNTNISLPESKYKYISMYCLVGMLKSIKTELNNLRTDLIVVSHSNINELLTEFEIIDIESRNNIIINKHIHNNDNMMFSTDEEGDDDDSNDAQTRNTAYSTVSNCIRTTSLYNPRL